MYFSFLAKEIIGTIYLYGSTQLIGVLLFTYSFLSYLNPVSFLLCSTILASKDGIHSQCLPLRKSLGSVSATMIEFACRYDTDHELLPSMAQLHITVLGPSVKVKPLELTPKMALI